MLWYVDSAHILVLSIVSDLDIVTKTSKAIQAAEWSADADYWTFFWGAEGESEGEGAGCIKSPKDGSCGCENSDGIFIYGGSNCS